MTRAALLATALVSAMHAAAQEAPLSAAEFDAITRGTTHHFTLGDTAYGAEQYFDGHRSLWQYGDTTCEMGHWWERDGLICFSYESEPEEQCWRVTRSGSGFNAELFRQDLSTDLVVTSSGARNQPLSCLGPRVGS